MRVNHQVISKLLKSYKNEKDFTFDELGSELGISSRTCKSIINDLTNVSLETLIKICTIFRKDINTFIIYEESDGIKKSDSLGIKITDGIEYILDRFETLASEKGKVEGELERYKAFFGELPEVDMAAEPSPKFKKK